MKKAVSYTGTYLYPVTREGRWKLLALSRLKFNLTVSIMSALAFIKNLNNRLWVIRWKCNKTHRRGESCISLRVSCDLLSRSLHMAIRRRRKWATHRPTHILTHWLTLIHWVHWKASESISDCLFCSSQLRALSVTRIRYELLTWLPLYWVWDACSDTMGEWQCIKRYRREGEREREREKWWKNECNIWVNCSEAAAVAVGGGRK